MKCNHCGSEWHVSPGLSVSVTNCPFCGKAILIEKKKLETVEDVLVEINRRFGVSILTDETKLVAYFSDLAPLLSKQRRILGYFVECGGPQKLASVMKASENEQTICIKQIVKEMKDEMFIEETASRMICDSFLFAITGHHFAEVTTLAQPRTEVASGTPAIVKQVVSILSAQEQFQKGEDYYHGTPSVFRDYQCAIDCYKKAAEQGHAMAQCQLGLMYREGQGTAKDEKKAFEWFMKAANASQSCPRGKFYVGRCYHYGHGVPKDLKEAVRWYTIGANEGDSYSQINLGNCYEYGDGVEINYETAVYWYELSAKQGEPLAQCNLGIMYKHGRGVAKDKHKAFSLFKQSADQGEPFGILQMGLCYLGGDGVKEDKDQAFTFVKQAAELGGCIAQYVLAHGYDKGVWGVENPQEAFAWYKKAAQNGSVFAQSSLGRCYSQGYGVKKDPSEAVAWYQKAADNGNVDAQLWLGQAYDVGSPLVKDRNLAIHWYKQAAEKGNKTATTLLRKLCGIDLSEARVASLVKKYQLEHEYLTPGSIDFAKKITKAANAYAPTAFQETPVVMEDNTIFGSAKEGFILTQKNLYYNGGFMEGKSSYPVDKIKSVSITLNKLSDIFLEIASNDPYANNTKLNITCTYDRDEAVRIQKFWNELLGFSHS